MKYVRRGGLLYIVLPQGGSVGTRNTIALRGHEYKNVDTTLVYDSFGRRVRKSSGGNTDFIYGLSGRVVTEYYGTGWGPGYVYLGSSLVAEYVNGTIDVPLIGFWNVSHVWIEHSCGLNIRLQ